MKSEIIEALNKFDEQMKAIGGCTDGHCCIKPPLGMHTNGGCHCMEDKYKARRMAFAAKELRGAILNILDFPQEAAAPVSLEALEKAWRSDADCSGLAAGYRLACSHHADALAALRQAPSENES